MLRLTLLALAAANAATGIWQVVSPGSFYDAIANFGPRSDHALRDIASYYLAAGVALYLAADRPRWRVPVLSLVGLQYVLHAINHIADAGDASPAWVGWFDVVVLTATAALIGWALREASREEAATLRA